MMFIILVIALWSACLFYVAGTTMNYDNNDSWIQNQGLLDCTNFEKYINSLYFTITTMTTIGYGDIKPRNNNEYMVVIFLELLAGITFAFIIGKIGSLF